MKKTNLALAVILSLSFSLPTYANQVESSEAESRKMLSQVNLKVKAENLQSLLNQQWIIENMASNSAEGLYINHHDNPFLAMALGALVMEGLIVKNQISFGKSQGQNVKESIREHLKAMKESPGHGVFYTVILGGTAGVIVYAFTAAGSETSRVREHYKELARNGKLDAAYKANQEQIEVLSKEIVELKKQTAN